MKRMEFVEQYEELIKRAMYCAQKARREGLLALENELNREKADERDVLEYGLRFVVDGVDQNIIDKILSNIVEQEKDERKHILKNIQKEAVLNIQDGINPELLYAILNSFSDISLNEDKTRMAAEPCPLPDIKAETISGLPAAADGE